MTDNDKLCREAFCKERGMPVDFERLKVFPWNPVNDEWHRFQCGWSARDAKVAELRQKLEQDAGRYRWLRDEHDVAIPLGRVSWKMFNLRDSANWGNIIDSEDLDNRIDAAMLASKPTDIKEEV